MWATNNLVLVPLGPDVIHFAITGQSVTLSEFYEGFVSATWFKRNVRDFYDAFYSTVDQSVRTETGCGGPCSSAWGWMLDINPRLIRVAARQSVLAADSYNPVVGAKVGSR